MSTAMHNTNQKPVLESLCVFCGSSPGDDAAYMEIARQTGICLASNNVKLVYGGGGYGLMGGVARSAHTAGGEVLGIIPEFLKEAEKLLKDVPHRIVPDMHSRKTQMYEESDGFIVLPGGIGTLEEAVEILSWSRLSLHTKPVVFLAPDDYWAPLATVFDHIVSHQFTPDEFTHHYAFVKTPDAALDIIRERLAHPPPQSPLRVAVSEVPKTQDL